MIDERGNIHASNGRAHELLGSEQAAAVRASLVRVIGREARTVEAGAGLQVDGTPLGAQPEAWLCRELNPRAVTSRGGYR